MRNFPFWESQTKQITVTKQMSWNEATCAVWTKLFSPQWEQAAFTYAVFLTAVIPFQVKSVYVETGDVWTPFKWAGGEKRCKSITLLKETMHKGDISRNLQWPFFPRLQIWWDLGGGCPMFPILPIEKGKICTGFLNAGALLFVALSSSPCRPVFFFFFFLFVFSLSLSLFLSLFCFFFFFF